MKDRPPFSRIRQLYRGLPTSLFSLSQTENAQQMAYLRSLVRERRQHETLHTRLDQLQTAVFDLETTGFFPEHGDEIISVGAVIVKGEKILYEQKFYSLIKPQREIPPEIEQLTAITNQMADEAPALSHVLIQFFSFVDRRALVAHGSAHDGKFLNAALRKSSRTSLSHRMLDTMMIGCKLFPDHIHFTLDDWLDYYQLADEGRHHALQDSLMTAKLWVLLLGELRRRGMETLGDLYAFLG